MKPILYEKTETAFTTNGLGRLWDATEASVIEEVNGEYTLTVSCPVNGKHVEDIQKGRILLAKPNDVDQAQPFRITGIHKTLGGGVTVTARHISYDTRKIVVTPISVINLGQLISTLPSKLVTTSGFTSFSISSDVSRSATFYREEPVTLRSLLSADDTSIPTVYGVEAKYDRFSIVFKARRGADNGVGMRYGKNLVSLETDESEDDVYATILPFYKDNEGGCVYGSLCTAIGYTAIGAVPVDVSSYLTAGQSTQDETWYPTQAAVTAAGAQWLAENKPYIPQRQISATPAELSGINSVGLGDTVHVYYPALDITEEYRIARLTYDVLMERVSGVDLMLNNLSGGVVVKPMVWQGQGQMSGVASAMKTETDRLEKKVGEAKSLSSQLANGTYKGGSFMDDDNVYAPHTWGGATLNVGANGGSIGPSGSVAGKYNFNVDSNGSLRIGPMSAASQEEASLEEDESSSSGSESKDPSVVYKFDFDAAENVLSLHGNYAVHNSAGTKIGYMGRITGSAGDSGSTEGVAFTVGNNPQSVTDANDSFFLATSGGARLNYHGNKVYASGNYVKMEHSSGAVVQLSSGAILLSAGGHYITIDSSGAKYDGDEIKT